MPAPRLLLAAGLVTAAAALGACGSGSGDDHAQAATQLGTPANPVPARPQPNGIPSRVTDPAGTGAGKATGPAAAAGSGANEGARPGPTNAASSPVGYQKLVEQQNRKPTHRFTPCGLVSRAQARAIVGVAVHTPIEAPQGPTCIYRTTDSRGFVTVAVQQRPYATVKRALEHVHAVRVGGRSAVCGTYGQAQLAVPLSGGRVLNVGAPCAVAQRFAAQALQHLQD